MSTRGTIVLKIKDKDIGTKEKVNPYFLSDNLRDIAVYNEKCFEIELTNKYAEIYVHHDAYPEYLGECLTNNWEFYQKVLNLILGGNTSNVGENLSDAYVLYDEDYKKLKPEFTDEIPKISEEYQYLYDDGTWYVRDIYNNKEFRKVVDVLTEIES